MIEIAGVVFEGLIALTYLILGAGEVRRAHGPPAALLVSASAVVLLTTCGWRGLVLAGVISTPSAFAALTAAYGAARIILVSFLVGLALVLVARRLERRRSREPRQF